MALINKCAGLPFSLNITRKTEGIRKPLGVRSLLAKGTELGHRNQIIQFATGIALLARVSPCQPSSQSLTPHT